MIKFDNVIRKRYHLILNEEDVINTLKVIHQTCDSWLSVYSMDIVAGNCGWMDETKWFIHFDCSKKEWNVLCTKLNIIKVFKNSDIPDFFIQKIYEVD